VKLRSDFITLTLLVGGSILTSCTPNSGSQKEALEVSVSTPPLQAQALIAPPTTGAYSSGMYRNLVSEAGVTANIATRLNNTWDQFFTSTDNNKRLYYPAGSNSDGELAYIYDANDNDVRSEGMSYGMMIAVQMDKQPAFDALWNWSKTYMQQSSGDYQDYFAWHCRTDGTKIDQNPAPDGEEYLAMSLLFAAGRWGNKTGIHNYQKEANDILNVMIHKEDMNGGVVGGVTNMFNDYNQVVFVPSTDSGLNSFTDPSYHVAAFYDLFSQWASGYTDRTADRARWASIADASRYYLFDQAANSSTGLSPDYSEFDGTPKSLNSNDGHDNYAYDAWRVSMNWAVDYAWFAKVDNEKVLVDRLQSFMESKGVSTFNNTYTVGGQALDTYRDSGHVAMLATSSLASTQVRGDKFVQELWNSTQIPSGQYRYYSGLLYFMGLLHTSGNFRIYKPSGV